MNIFKKLSNFRGPATASGSLSTNAAAEDGIAAEQAPVHSPVVVAIPLTRSDANAASESTTASDQLEEAIANNQQCTLTIGEAQSIFVKNLRRPLARRTMQEYCQKGIIVAQLLTISQGREWIINEPSLLRFMERYPISLSEEQAAQLTLAPSASHKLPVDEQKPIDADHHSSQQTREKVAAVATREAEPPASTKPDIARTTTAVLRSAQPKRDQPEPGPSKAATAERSTDKAGSGARVANDDSRIEDEFADPSEIGETRRLADLLLEVSRLTAVLDGKDNLVDALKSHDKFLRTQVEKSNEQITYLSSKVVDVTTAALGTINAAIAASGPRELRSADDENARGHRLN